MTKLRNINILLLGSYVALQFGIAVLTGCSSGSTEEPAIKDNLTHLRNLENSIDISFPEGPTLIRYERVTGSDALIRAKLIFTPGQWARFVNTSPIDRGSFIENKRYLLGTNDGWWNPQDSKALPTIQVLLPDAKVFNVGVDRSDSKAFLVFLVWHGT